MLEFKVLKQSEKSKARLGLLKTANGIVETPTLVPVATQAVVKTLTSEEAAAAGSQMLICNTFHLRLKPGEKFVKSAGGLHKFMNWPRPLMTDSGGFQVFSLGFGKDLGVGKIIKEKTGEIVRLGQQPKLLKITDEGVHFTSFLDGSRLFLGPEESMKIQQALGADIIFAFDECPPPAAEHAYIKKSLERTHRWAKVCLKAKRNKHQALFGIVQGGRYKDLGQESARFINSQPFDGFGIGGEFGEDKKSMMQMLGWVTEELDPKKPRHLLGVGYLEDIPKIIKQGIDTFDCIVPTHYARHGIAFISSGTLDLLKSVFLKDKKPLDPKCSCAVCANYSRSYISHLFRAKEITALKLLTFHNLFFFNQYVSKIREDIRNNKV